MTDKKRIAFFIFSSRDLNTFPYVTNPAQLLAEKGIQVDIYMPEAMKTALSIRGVQYVVTACNTPSAYVEAAVGHIINRRLSYSLLASFSLEGLVASSRLISAMGAEVPIAYFSLELVYQNYLSRKYFNISFLSGLLYGMLRGIIERKRFSYAASSMRYMLHETMTLYTLRHNSTRKAPFGVVQDAGREGLLRKEFPFLDKVFLVPNSYIGYIDDSSDFAFRRFGIPQDRKILLYSGGVERGFDLDMIDICREFGPEYVLFLNAYSRDNYLEEVSMQYEGYIRDGRLVINSENLREDEYQSLVRSAYIGLCWYPKDIVMRTPNQYYMGLSSGKLMRFLSCGRPVITPDFLHGYPELIDGNRLGRTCAEASDIPGMVKAINEDYKSYRPTIRAYYEEHLEYMKCFDTVCYEILRLIGLNSLSRNPEEVH